MMEVSSLQTLLSDINSFPNLSDSTCANLDSEPVRKYYLKIEEMLELLKLVLESIIETDVDLLSNKAFLQLARFVDESRDLFETWHPLASRFTFVLESESLITKTRSCVLEIFRLLKNAHDTLPAGLSADFLEFENSLPTPASRGGRHFAGLGSLCRQVVFRQKYLPIPEAGAVTVRLTKCTQKVERIVCEKAETLISEAVKEKSAGHVLSPEKLVEMADLLAITSNQEIFIEAVALEKLKENAEQAENKADMEYFDQLITLIMQLHDYLVMIKHSPNSTPVPIPADICCPLSLDLMTDPVIVSSGQTYERVYIRKWLDLGLNVCPKTRQTLGRTNLTPNYTVKALIASWCEQNSVKLPDPKKSMSLNQPLVLISPTDCDTLKESCMVPCCTIEERAVNRRTASVSPQVRRFGAEDSLDIERASLEEQPSFTAEKCLHPSVYDSLSSSAEEITNSVGSHERLAPGRTRTTSNSYVIPDKNRSSDVTQISQSQDSHITVGSGQLMKETPAPPRLIGTRSRNGAMLRQTSGRHAPRFTSSSAMEIKPDQSRVENEVKKLVEDLNSSSIERQREAAAELRVFAKQNMDNRVIIANCGAISLLVKLLHSTDSGTQENAVTTLLNLSLSDNNKTTIASAGAIEPLIHVLRTGSPEARGNSAATLFSLSVIEENKLKIGRAGAIGPLVELLGDGSLSAKKDATTALYNLSILHENKPKIVEAGAIRHLIDLMDPAVGMVDKAVAALANLATIPEGKDGIGLLGGIPVLVEVVELGSSRGKENAAAALLQLCMTSPKFCSMALQEGVVPPLVALSQSGTARGKEKAQALLTFFRNQRHGNLGRG